MRHFLQAIVALILIGTMQSIRAQDVSVPDPNLIAAIRDALQKPTEPLTDQDLLSLTNLNASSRNIRSVEGLNAASNLALLNLSSNDLGNISIDSGLEQLHLAQLKQLDLSFNRLVSLDLSPDLTNLASLELASHTLVHLGLPV